MNILVLNCGSSTLKFQLIEVSGEGVSLPEQRRLAGGIVDKIGGQGRVEFSKEGGDTLRGPIAVADHGEATRVVLDWLAKVGFRGRHGIAAVGHRVVHGGDRFSGATVIDDRVISTIEEVSHLAPLHNGPSLQAIRAAREWLGPRVLMVAVFDTAFHQTMPEYAWRYAIPQELADKHGARRYGFHGIAHRYITERYAAIVFRPVEEVRLITLQLGNGCSATAVEGGHSADTSMGLTPLEGLMMGTRCGDVDPSLAGFLARREGIEVEEVETWLNKRSGLLGISGCSEDMRELLEREARGDPRVSLAIDMFCYRVRKYIGAYLAVLGGADAVVFGGGIGENAPAIRARICTGMEWCGLVLDQERNAGAMGSEAKISAHGARIDAYVIPVDEATIIAYDTYRCLRGNSQEGT